MSQWYSVCDDAQYVILIYTISHNTGSALHHEPKMSSLILVWDRSNGWLYRWLLCDDIPVTSY